MTRRGLFKMLAATPLAGIVAKFAPKPKPNPFINMFNPSIDVASMYLTGWTPRTREEIQASFAAMDSMPKIGSTLNIRRPNRANIQS